jgi:TolA-binding protein
MRSIPAFTLVGFILSAAPAVAQREVARPALAPTAGGQVLLSDVSNSYAQMEKNIELTYAKLKQETKGKIEALNDQIKDLAKQIEALKEQVKKLEQLLAKIEQDKERALTDLRKQKEKALADARKAQDARLVRLPTPTPTPKRP